jgi:hypothetical protein
MIFAKINPPLSIAEQTNPFSQNVSFRIGDYMAVIANPYRLGESEVNFTVSFGSCSFNETNEITHFVPYHRENITLSGTIIENWGNDDNIILKEIATQKSLNITNMISGSLIDAAMFF